MILVAPVTGIATLGFSIAMDESKGAKGSSSSLLGLFQTLLGGVISPLVGIKGDSNAIPYIIVIVITAIILMVLQLINVKIFKKLKFIDKIEWFSMSFSFYRCNLIVLAKRT